MTVDYLYRTAALSEPQLVTAMTGGCHINQLLRAYTCQPWRQNTTSQVAEQSRIVIYYELACAFYANCCWLRCCHKAITALDATLANCIGECCLLRLLAEVQLQSLDNSWLAFESYSTNLYHSKSIIACCHMRGYAMRSPGKVNCFCT